jgi:hypothetical protein
MRRLCPLLFALATAAAVEIDLPAPERLTAHPDGARLAWRVDLPAGMHRVRLPPRLPGEPVVIGGATSWQRTQVAGPPLGEPPAGLAGLRQRRDRLAGLLQTIADRRQLAERWRLEWLERTPGATVTPAWQAALDDHLTRVERIDVEAAQAGSERSALIQEIAILTADAEGAESLLGLGGQDLRSFPVWPEESLRLRWAGRPTPGVAVLEVTMSEAAALRIVADSRGGGWTASTSATLDGSIMHLVRHAVLRKPAAEDWGKPQVRITTAPLIRPLSAPAPRRIAVAEDEAVSRRKTVEKSSSVGWGTVARSAPAATASSPALSDANPSPAAPPPAQVPPAEVADDRDPFAADLPAVALPVGAAQVTVALPASELRVLADEWMLAPQLSPIAVRRVSLRLDGAPVPGGPVSIADGAGGLRSGVLPDLPSGATCDLVVAEDDSVFVGETSTWQIDPATQTEKAQRHGADRWIWNTGQAARRLRVYLTTPVSRAREISVGLDAATSPGYSVIQPGVLRWEVDFSPLTPTRIGLGWTLQASGGAKL